MKFVKLAAIACLCAAFAAPRLKADEWNKRTVFTFSAPVEVPGKVLAPGTYVFKLANLETDRNMVEIYNQDETKLLGLFLTVPDYRMVPPSKPLIRFEETAAGNPEAIRAWFYPGDNYGNAFVYPKNRASQLAKSTHQSVPSMSSEYPSSVSDSQRQQQENAMKQTPLKAQQPSGEEINIEVAFPSQSSSGASKSSAASEQPLSALSNQSK